MSPETFFDLLFHTVSQTESKSLSYMVSLLRSDFGVSISKQSLSERFNSKSEIFVRAVLSEVLQEEFSGLYSDKLLPEFSRIRIKDSTKFMTPRSMETDYRGGGGDPLRSRSKSGVSIQYEYDLKSGRIMDLNITSGARNDRTDAAESAENVDKGDLIIRDLGYFSTPVLKTFTEKEAFYLSRLESGTNVYDLDNEQISFKDIYKSMQKSGISRKEMFVYVGKTTKLSARLILQRVPEQVYEKRIRDKTIKSKGQGRGVLTEETKIRSRFNLFITNATESQLSIEQVFPLYRLRWQIELQFKIWKSVFKIDNFQEINKHRYLTMLYVRLLLIVISLQITYSLQRAYTHFDSTKIKILSLNKCLKTLKCLFDKIFDLLRLACNKAKETTKYIYERLSENHWLESKKEKLSSPDILELMISVSE